MRTDTELLDCAESKPVTQTVACIPLPQWARHYYSLTIHGVEWIVDIDGDGRCYGWADAILDSAGRWCERASA